MTLANRPYKRTSDEPFASILLEQYGQDIQLEDAKVIQGILTVVRENIVDGNRTHMEHMWKLEVPTRSIKTLEQGQQVKAMLDSGLRLFNTTNQIEYDIDGWTTFQLEDKGPTT